MMRRVVLPAVLAAMLLAGCAQAPLAETAAPEPSPSVSSVRYIPSPAPVPSPHAPEATPTPEPTPAAFVMADLPVLNADDAATVLTSLPTDPRPDAPPTTTRVHLTTDIPAYVSPDDTVPPVGRIASLTVGQPTVLPAFEVTGDGWALVPVMARSGLPSEGTTGQAVAWVRMDANGVTLTEDDTALTVDLSAETLTVLDGDTTVLSVPVGVGKTSTPTPLGRTAVVSTWTDDAATYTAGHPILALARYSDVRDAFRPSGTDSGTQAPPLIAVHAYTTGATTGQVSNGCLRLSETDLLAVVGLVPIGTPALVVP